MIVDLPSTTTAKISKTLVRLRNEVGAMALGRVLTLVIIVDEADAEAAIEAANDASRQHPCRIVALVIGNRRAGTRIDGQVRVGGDAGASEVVVLRLYGALTAQGRAVVTPLLLPDSPIVAWWPQDAPANVAADPIGSIAQRRITDSAVGSSPAAALKRRAATYAAGDTDLAWSRVTLWRALLAAALDQAPYEPVLAATVTGASDSPSADLLAAWLANTLRCPVTRARSRRGTGLVSVRMERKGGNIDLVRPEGDTATLSQSRQPDRRISLARRSTAQCLADELRRLDPDEVYAETLRRGLSKVTGATHTTTASAAVTEGEAPSLEEAARIIQRVARKDRAKAKSAKPGSPTATGADEPAGVAAAGTAASKSSSSAKPTSKTAVEP